jgi:hypothetical protein
MGQSPPGPLLAGQLKGAAKNQRNTQRAHALAWISSLVGAGKQTPPSKVGYRGRSKRPPLARVAPTKGESAMVRLFLTAAVLLTLTSAAVADPLNLSCDEILRNGWNKMPDVADYIRTRPDSGKLGLRSACHLDSLVFAKCLAEPRRQTVRQAIDALFSETKHGKRLPYTPVCA